MLRHESDLHVSSFSRGALGSIYPLPTYLSNDENSDLLDGISSLGEFLTYSLVQWVTVAQ